MKWLLTIIVFISAAGSCDVSAKLDDWNDTNEALFYTYTALNIIDVGQTFNLIDCQNHKRGCRYYETNSIVGKRPDKLSILLVKGASIYGTYYLLDNHATERGRFVALSIINMMYIKTVHDNHEIGLRFSISF
jgi:hypothetical protein